MATKEWIELAEDERALWDDWLTRARDQNAFQSLAWGELKRLSGWDPVRLITKDAQGTIVGVVQILRRRSAGLAIGWSPGGPVLGFPETDIGRELAALSGALEPLGFRAVRFDSYLSRGGSGSYEFSRLLRPVKTRVNSGFTSQIDLRSISEAQTTWSTNHLRNLRRAEAAGLELRVAEGPSGVGEFLALYQAMRTAKELKHVPDLSHDVSLLGGAFGDDALVFNVYQGGTAVSTALVLRSGRHAIFITGATPPRGRELSAGHLLFHELFRELVGRGVDTFDFGGLDPRTESARGVDLFKLGFGGVIQERVGEWDWARNRLTHLGFNMAMRLRRARG